MFLKSATVNVMVGLVVLSSASYAIAQEAPVFSAKDWRLEESAAGVCIAATTAKSAETALHLEVVLDKSGQSLLEVRIRPEAETLAVAMKTALDKKKELVYSFAKLPAEAGGASVLWNIPRGTEDLLAYLKRESKLEVSLVEAVPPQVAAK
ncbi:MAG: hypothetical protein V4692_06820, partial [Bdellovibrionota bacterium]